MKAGTVEKFLDKESWRSYGAVSTPSEIVDLMIELSGVKSWRGLEILEPGAGFCGFLRKIKKRHPENRFTGVEINREIFRAAAAMRAEFNLVLADFLLWDAPGKYELIIGNPPYGIIGDKSHYPIHIVKESKKAYKTIFQTWFGKYNIYGAFIEKSVSLLKPGGCLAFIVPATFMVLDDFKLLRKFLAGSGRTKIYYLGPKTFPGKNVSAAIIIFTRGAQGIELYEIDKSRHITKHYEKEKYGGGLIRFESADTDAFERGKAKLGELFEIHFAARSPEIKKHPLTSTRPGKGLVPVLTGRNLHKGWIDYGRCFSGFYFPLKSVGELRRFYATKHIVIGHTKGTRLEAAIDDRGYPWREDIHLIPKTKNIALKPVLEYLNRAELEWYLRSLYKEISPHLTITQLKLLPIPDLGKGAGNICSGFAS